MKGVVPAAGRGSRLGSLTRDRPKGLVDVAGRPLLSYPMDAAIEAGVEELVVVVGYEGDRIVDRFGDRYRDAPVTYVRQHELRGLADAVLQAEPYVDGRFLVVNGDNVFVDGIADAVDAVADPNVDAVLGVEDTSLDVARTTGVVEIGDGTVSNVVEKPDEPPSTLVTTGCYVLPAAVFAACEAVGPSAEGEYQLSEAVGRLARTGYTVETVDVGRRVNVNTRDDISTVESLLTGGSGSLQDAR